MIILKIILCSSLLIASYYLFLQKEKMYRFNRYFLIFSLIFSYIIPFVIIKTGLPATNNKSQLILGEASQQILAISKNQVTFDWIRLLWIAYGIITLFFLIKVFISILKINRLKGNKIIYQNQKVTLTKEDISPFSFWNTIYIGQNHFRNNEIDPRIFLHEKSHLDQKHSLDILLIEILKIFTWFNPALYFYKKAVLTNHEFLADENVLKSNFNIKEYQDLILLEIISTQNYNLTHRLNFTNTKKRFIMMNSRKSKLIGLKKALSISALMMVFILFVQKVHANSSKSAIENQRKLLTKLEEAPPNFSLNTEAKEESLNIKNEEKKVLNTIIQRKTVDTQLIELKSTTTNSDKKFVQDLAISTPMELIQENTTMPEYPGGINVMRNKVSQNFNGLPFKGNEGLVRSDIQFVIDEKGEVSNIKTMGSNEIFNNEAYKAVKLANENITWQPATKDGQPVKYIFKLPLTMVFESGKKTQ